MDTVEKYFEEITKRLPDISINLILVNDGSTRDLSLDIKTLQSSLGKSLSVLVNDRNYGKGSATRKGIAQSQAEHIIFTDVDFPYTAGSLVSVYKALKDEKSDVVIGVRDENYYDTIPQSRKRISTLLKKANQNLFKLITSDTQCGLKGMNQKGKEILLKTKENRYLFDLEFVKLASSQDNLKVKLETVELRAGVSFSNVPLSKIAGESLSYLKILFAR